MRDLYIYHPGTGTCISLADPVYLVDATRLCERDLNALEQGTLDKFASSVVGYRIDHTNMDTSLFRKDGSDV